MNQYDPYDNPVYRTGQPRRANGGGGVNPGGQAQWQQPTGYSAPMPGNPFNQAQAPQGPAASQWRPGTAPQPYPMGAQAAPVLTHEQRWADSAYVNATLGQRVGAYLLDGIVLTLVEVLIMSVFGGFGSLSNSNDAELGSMIIGLIVMGFVSASYKIVLEATMGQTLGKKMLGLRLVTTDGLPMGWGHAFKRNFNQLYPVIPILGGFMGGVSLIGRFFSVMNSPYSQGYHDRWGNTRLIKER